MYMYMCVYSYYHSQQVIWTYGSTCNRNSELIPGIAAQASFKVLKMTVKDMGSVCVSL